MAKSEAQTELFTAMQMTGSEPVDRPSSMAPAEGFAYDQLDLELAALAHRVAEKVRKLHRRHVAAVLEAGRELLRVKALLNHGQFGGWVRAEFGCERTAQNYMRAASLFAGKSALVSHLQPTTIYRLSASTTPEAVREETMTRLGGGERLDDGTIAEIVKEGRKAAKKARADERLTDRQRKRRSAARARKARDIAQNSERWEQEHARRRVARRDAAVLIVNLAGDALAELRELLAEAGAITCADLDGVAQDDQRSA